jgi:hypothetical protein
MPDSTKLNVQYTIVTVQFGFPPLSESSVMKQETTACTSIASAKICLSVSATVFFCACATSVTRPSGFLSDYNALRPSAFDNVALYRAPGFDPRAYGQVRVTPAQIYGPSARLRELDPELQKEVLTQTDKEMNARLRAGVGPRALIVRAAVTDVDTPNRALNVATSLLIGPTTSGGASLELEVVDEQSSAVLVAATCTERGSVLRQFAGAYSVLAHAKHAISECLQRFEKAYRAEPLAGPATAPRD